MNISIQEEIRERIADIVYESCYCKLGKVDVTDNILEYLHSKGVVIMSEQALSDYHMIYESLIEEKE